jgi:tRNA-dihydrouridine synthase B
MVGRGAYGRPWFLNQISHFLKTNEKLPDPPLEEQKNIVLEHFQDMLIHYGEHTGLLMARKHMGWYSKGLKDSSEFRAAINLSTNRQSVENLIHEFYDKNLSLA